MARVLVTGGSGFVGSHIILQLLAAGHQVCTTVRDLKREDHVRAMLKEGGAEPGDSLSFVAADLEGDAAWPEAVAGCDYVLHVASPIPLGNFSSKPPDQSAMFPSLASSIPWSDPIGSLDNALYQHAQAPLNY
jgi:nucleoside-diphosphate-sugar epimerase